MSSIPQARLHAATATGTLALSVIDFSLGGLLIEASTPFEVGSEFHLRLSTASGVFAGTFALRCLHSHRSSRNDDQGMHLSALVFVHPPDAIRETLAHLWEHPTPPVQRAHQPQRALRLVSVSTAP